MKYAAIIVLVLVLAAGGVTGYELLNTRLQVTGQGLSVVPAQDKPAEFENLRLAMEREALHGTVFESGSLSSADSYTFQVYTVRLKNNGLLPAQMVEVQLSPLSGDVLFYGETGESIVAAGAARDISVVLLTKDGAKTARDLYITYYIWGHPLSIKFTYSG